MSLSNSICVLIQSMSINHGALGPKKPKYKSAGQMAAEFNSETCRLKAEGELPTQESSDPYHSVFTGDQWIDSQCKELEIDDTTRIARGHRAKPAKLTQTVII